MTVAATASGQLVRRPPPDTSLSCQLWDICRPPQRVALPQRPVPTTDPTLDYTLPRTVGVAQIAYDAAWPYGNGQLNHFTTGELFDELAGHGIRAVRLWLSADYWEGIEHPTNPLLYTYPDYPIMYEDMNRVWAHPQIDVIVVIFLSPAHSDWEEGCRGGQNVAWANEPTYKIADFLFRHFGHLDKTIIFANPETDNQWRGFDCVEPWEFNFETMALVGPEPCTEEETIEACVYRHAMARMDLAQRKIEARQIAIEQARAEHPGATLRILNSMTVHVFTPEQAEGKYLGKFALRDMKFEHDPDIIGASVWGGGDVDVANAIWQIRKYTGYPAERIFIDQVGANETWHGKQYQVLMDRIPQAFDAGVNLAMVWMWRMTWHHFGDAERPRNKGMFEWLTTEGRVEWGAPNSGLEAIYELNEIYEHD